MDSTTLSFSEAGRRLILFGGGPCPVEGLTEFVKLAGSSPKEKRILIISWASQDPLLTSLELYDEFRKISSGDFHYDISNQAPKNQHELRAFLSELSQASGVFFSGGDQESLMKGIESFPEIKKALFARYEAGTVIGGSCAGTAIMSSLMIVQDGDPSLLSKQNCPTAQGLGLLPGCLVDQHFLKRQRQNRLFGLLLSYPKLLGIGIDEGACLMIVDNDFAQVLGAGQVMIVDALRTAPSLRIDILNKGECFDLQSRTRVSAAVENFRLPGALKFLTPVADDTVCS